MVACSEAAIKDVVVELDILALSLRPGFRGGNKDEEMARILLSLRPGFLGGWRELSSLDGEDGDEVSLLRG